MVTPAGHDGKYQISHRDRVPLPTCGACTHPAGPVNWVPGTLDPRHATRRFPAAEPPGSIPVTEPAELPATDPDFCTRVNAISYATPRRSAARTP